jgi:hypothetical protein
MTRNIINMENSYSVFQACYSGIESGVCEIPLVVVQSLYNVAVFLLQNLKDVHVFRVVRPCKCVDGKSIMSCQLKYSCEL